MRKISKTLAARTGSNAVDSDLRDLRPGRIGGSTVTARPAPDPVNLTALFARGAAGATIYGSAMAADTGAGGAVAGHGPAGSQRTGAVALSDGTQITFTTAGQFTVIDLV
jgi:hypothetical protein